MNLEQARFNMVEQQIRTWEVLDQDVLDLLYLVPREEFVPSQHRSLAFLEQLAVGGRLFAVTGEAPAMSARLVVCTAPGAYHSTDLFETVIAPLVNAEQPPRFRF